MKWMGLHAVKALFVTTILYGFVTPFLIMIILHIANNKKIMGEFSNSRSSNIVGFGALSLMLASVIATAIIILLNK
jgi:Mn2+/Fe2+ NRAMP family transporter